MANEVWTTYETGNNLYARIRRRTDSKVYDVVAGGNTFDTWSDADVDDYDLVLTDEDGNFYAVNFPSGISVGVYDVGVFLRAGANPATGDNQIGQGVMYWDGTAELNSYTLDVQINDDIIGADGDTLESLSDQLDALSAEGSKVANVYGPGE